MNPKLLHYYNEELTHLREVGGEFASAYPNVARRLSMEAFEVADPYVERLLEGFAFLAARVQLKLDAQYPQFVAHLLDTLYPNFLAPVPSMMVARLHADLTNPALQRGLHVPRGSTISSQLSRGQNSHCEFRTAHAVQLWPIEVVDAKYFLHAPDLPLAQLPVSRQARSGLRLRLRAHGGLDFAQLPLDVLQLHLSAKGNAAWQLHELLGSRALGTLVWPSTPGGIAPGPLAPMWRDARVSLRMSGFDDEQALLPESNRTFSSYRLLQELAAFSHRFLFFEVMELAPRLARSASTEVDLVVLFSQAEPKLESAIDASSVSLFCTPAINLFSKRLDRIQVTSSEHEFHVVPDRSRPMDFEVHGVESVIGYSSEQGAQQFLPLYATFHTEKPTHRAYFTLRRATRVLSQRQKQQGTTRSPYIGSEVFLSLVDPLGAPFDEDLRQLAVQAWVTQRDLPLLVPGTPTGELNEGNLAWTIDGMPAVRAVECLRGPTRPSARSAEGDHGWSLVNHLAMNHVALAHEDPQRAAATLRTMLRLYGPEEDEIWRKQTEGVSALRTEPITRRLPHRGPLAYGLGVRVEVEVDDLVFPGSSAFVLGSVLDHYFARQAAINTFTETVLRSTARGLICQWPPRIGAASELGT